MRKILLFSAVIFTMLNAYAQGDTTIIKMLPKEGQGYLVLNMVLNNNLIDNWKVDIKEKIIDSNNNVTYTTIKKESLYGVNYLKIEDTIYNNDKYVLDIKAYDINRNNIGEIGDVIMEPPNNHPFLLQNTWKCNGLYYAYEIQQLYQNSTGASIFQLSTTGTGFATDPYYFQYSGNSNDADAWIIYHDRPTNLAYDSGTPTLLHYQNATATYYDATGNPITNNVYGVAKNLGPWLNAPFYLEDNDGSAKKFYNNNFDNYSLGAIIGFYNAYANFQQAGYPPLTCQLAIETLGGEGPEINYDCLQTLYLETGYLDMDGIYELIQAIDECSNGGDPNQVPENNYTAFVINLSDTSNTPIINIPFNGMVDENGNIIAPTFTMPKGLFYIDVINKRGQHAYFIKETTEAIINNLQQKDFLTATAFPVPIIDNTFSLHLHATANVKFTYTLTNLDGNVIYTENFKLAKGYDRNHQIQMPEGQIIPSGILVNRFEFSDGSVMTFQSVKN